MFVPEERLGHAAVPQLNLRENVLLTNVSNQDASKNGIVNRRYLLDKVNEITEQFNVRHAGSKLAARNLSGGNLQKFVVGREINKLPSVLIINQPTWGVDAVSAVRIREALLTLAASGSAIVVISQDLDELLEISDQLAVLHHGSLSDAKSVDAWNIEQLGLAMTGGISGRTHNTLDQPAIHSVGVINYRAVFNHRSVCNERPTHRCYLADDDFSMAGQTHGSAVGSGASASSLSCVYCYRFVRRLPRQYLEYWCRGTIRIRFNWRLHGLLTVGQP